jgi:8-amino-7-oxononanoate synthase
VAAWRRLLEIGVYVNLVLPQATPNGRPLLRVSVSAAHTGEQITTVADAFAKIAAAMPGRSPGR